MSKCIRIERIALRPDRTEVDQAYLGPQGYELAGPEFSSDDRKQPENSIFVKTLDEAARLIEDRGFHIRMGNPPDRPSLIQPSSVRIIRR